VPRYIREPKDEIDHQLIKQGWEMVGINGWTHPEIISGYVTREKALTIDMSHYHPIAREHEKMLNFLYSVASAKPIDQDTTEAAFELLAEMGYEKYGIG